MKKPILLFNFLLVVILSYSQTNISGSINVDSTLSVAGSPYTITTNLTIEDGAYINH